MCLQREIRFYIVKSPSVNAFAADQGIVFVNLGLLAQVENEAQLAFVLAHEIVHYMKKHSIERYVESYKYTIEASDYQNLSYDNKLESLMKYNKDQEFESDKYALIDFYSKTEYSSAEILSLFDVLLHRACTVLLAAFANHHLHLWRDLLLAV